MHHHVRKVCSINAKNALKRYQAIEMGLKKICELFSNVETINSVDALVRYVWCEWKRIWVDWSVFKWWQFFGKHVRLVRYLRPGFGYNQPHCNHHEQHLESAKQQHLSIT